MFKELHGNMKTRVTFNGQLLGELVIDNGVKQGAILLPHYSPFSSLCFWLTHSKNVIRVFSYGLEFQVRCSTWEYLTQNQRYLLNWLENFGMVIMLFFFAHRQTFLKYIMDHFSRAYNTFALYISLKKTKVILPLVNLLLSLISK